jgi:hypothetical protein
MGDAAKQFIQIEVPVVNQLPYGLVSDHRSIEEIRFQVSAVPLLKVTKVLACGGPPLHPGYRARLLYRADHRASTATGIGGREPAEWRVGHPRSPRSSIAHGPLVLRSCECILDTLFGRGLPHAGPGPVLSETRTGAPRYRSRGEFGPCRLHRCGSHRPSRDVASAVHAASWGV